MFWQSTKSTKSTKSTMTKVVYKRQVLLEVVKLALRSVNLPLRKKFAKELIEGDVTELSEYVVNLILSKRDHWISFEKE